MWEFDNNKPIYIQIVDRIKGKIVSGEYKAGEKIDSVREFAVNIGVNPNTMQKALSLLETEGLIYTNRTSGKFITEDVNKISEIKSIDVTEAVDRFISQMKKQNITKAEVIALIDKKEF